MPFSVWKKLSLPELTPTRMTLELANRSFAYPIGVAEDVFVKVEKFQFPADFVVVDYDVDPQNNFEEVLKIKKITYHLSGTTTSTPDSSPSLTPGKTSDSILEEFADELALLDPFPPGISDADFDPEGEILLLENDDESPPKADVPEENFKIYSNPLFEFDEEYISSNDECFDLGGDIDEIDAFLVIDVSTDIEDGYHNSKGDIICLENLLNNDTIPYLPPEVFLDHDPRSLKDELDNNDLKIRSRFLPVISTCSFNSLEPVGNESPMEVSSPHVSSLISDDKGRVNQMRLAQKQALRGANPCLSNR
ncbi:hypothetical protein Tco_0751805 [Tanacetum coccineum]|uniref:Reverse transcriptase domain-containing protein n=1 Tax=Tanacetum coccineum TaxID=301880 RepID=A0ABQ4Z582_9ASTR